MKVIIVLPFAVMLLGAVAPLRAQDAPAPAAWTNAAGITIRGDFVKLEGETLTIRKDGKEFRIPMDKLSLASRKQARELAKNSPATPVADASAAAPEVPPKAFGKQTDPDHQRKLAESILAKKGTVEIWRGSGQLAVARLDDLPKDKIELKSVDSTGAPFTDEDAQLLNGCKDLTRLKTFGASVDALPLESLTKLQTLELYQTRAEAQALSGLRGNKSLKELVVWHLPAPIGGNLIPILAACPNLEMINLHKAGLGGASLAPLGKLRFVKTIWIGGNDYTDRDLAVLTGFPALESLNLGESNLTSQTLDFLPKLKLVRSLDLATSQFSEQGFANVAAMPALANLQLFRSNVNDGMLRSLGGHKTLRELYLGETKVTGEGLIGLKPLQNLVLLHLNGASACPNDDVVKAIPVACPNLTELNLNATHVGPAGYLSLAGLKKINRLHLNGASGLDQAAMDCFGRMKSLTGLGLSGSSINGSQLGLLKNLMGSLTELSLDNTRIDDQAVEILARFRALTILNITGTDISRDGAERLRKALPGCNVTY